LSLTPDPEYISGVILYDETLLDFKLSHILSDKGIIPGVRANGELRSFPHSPSEFIVEGLDGLLPKLQAARLAGARFSKFRVPIACTSAAQGLPTQASLEVQAETLAQYAAISQQAGLVPIVEPDVEFSEDADLARSTEVHHKAISLIYARCLTHGVLLEGTTILILTRCSFSLFVLQSRVSPQTVVSSAWPQEPIPSTSNLGRYCGSHCNTTISLCTFCSSGRCVFMRRLMVVRWTVIIGCNGKSCCCQCTCELILANLAIFSSPCIVVFIWPSIARRGNDALDER
jgi:hypothetical protein